MFYICCKEFRKMKPLIPLVLCLVCAPLWAQTTRRDSVLTEARYLKSIYKMTRP